MSFPGDTLEERATRAAIRLGAPSGGPGWNASSDYYQELLWYLLNWPPNTPTTPPIRLYCGMLLVDIIKDLGTLTGLEQGDSSDFDFLGTALAAPDA